MASLCVGARLALVHEELENYQGTRQDQARYYAACCAACCLLRSSPALVQGSMLNSILLGREVRPLRRLNRRVGRKYTMRHAQNNRWRV